MADKTAPKRKAGRQLTYTPSIGATICDRLAAGESLRAICRDRGMPLEQTVRGWVIDGVEGFAAQYARARELQAMRWAEEILDYADDKKADANRSRLQVDTRKWLLSKVLPKVYGEKLDLNHSGSIGLVGALEAARERARHVRRG